MAPPTLVLTEGQGTADDGRSGDTHRSIPVRSYGSWLRRFCGFIGPGYLVAVGYMDPGNWATDLAGGSAYGYSLLWVILMSNLMAMVLQVLAARLGIVAGRDLAQLCRQHSSPMSNRVQWILCELAICACDLAEVIGTAIGLNLLFGIPLTWGVGLTVLDVLMILWLQRCGFRYLEAFVISLLTVVFVCFTITVLLAQPQWHDVALGLIPSARTITDPGMLYIGIGIIGATVMPHNLYLHSSTVQTRRFDRDTAGIKNAVTFSTVDVLLALSLAFLVNAAILITSAAIFHTSGHHEVTELQDAYHLLDPLTGSAIGSLLFGLALLAAGQSSSITATLAGQVVMEGYMQLRMAPWARRLLTRSLAIVPALLVTITMGESGIGKLLLFSQVILSLQLPFAMYPLIKFTSNVKIMGDFANSRKVVVIAWTIMSVIMLLNIVLIWKAIKL